MTSYQRLGPCLSLLLLHAVLLLLVSADDEELGEAMNFKINPLSEEEQFSGSLPEQFTCDACKVVVYQLGLSMDKVKPKSRTALAGKHAVQEQAALLAEALELACSTATYSEYGVKEFTETGEKALHGPGVDKEGVGVIQGGGLWASRMKSRCASLVEELEEEGIAERWRQGSLSKLCAEDCGESKRPTPRPRKRSRPAPTPTPREKETKSATVEKKEKTGLEELPPPRLTGNMHAVKPVDRQSFAEFVKVSKKNKFRFVLFYDATDMSIRTNTIVELAARQLEKANEKDIRRVSVARFDSRAGDTYGFSLKSLPKMMFWRYGYKNPKVFNGQMDGPDAVVDWIRNEIKEIYMKDDPDKFPRIEAGHGEL